MKLTVSGIKDTQSWEKNGYSLPKFNIDAMVGRTVENPIWLHFGAGNIFRIFPAMMQHRLLESGEADKGIVVCESFDEEIITKAYAPHDNLTVAVTLKSSGDMEKAVVAGIAKSICISDGEKELERIFSAKSLQMVSFTITEKGYADKSQNGLMSIVTRMLHHRYLSGKSPIALVSMDNCSHNGDKLREAVTAFAKELYNDKDFIAYLENPASVSFPLSMIDKITPRPSDAVKDMLLSDGLEDVEVIVTSKNTYISSFVNAEETGYLIIEDIFPNGRPKLELVGAIFTDRETVDKVEKMKVCTCLNPLHTVLAVYGCLLGYTSISSEMENADLKQLIKNIGYIEGLPVVINPEIIDPKQFIDEVINVRFPNPFVPDTPQRIACDTSQKIPVRFGETLKAYIANGYDVSKLTYIPLFFAGWLRYLMGTNDNGAAFEISPDPMLNELLPILDGIDTQNYKEKIQPILSNAAIFGVDLYACNLAEKVNGYFYELIQGNGSIANTLKKYCGADAALELVGEE